MTRGHGLIGLVAHSRGFIGFGLNAGTKKLTNLFGSCQGDIIDKKVLFGSRLLERKPQSVSLRSFASCFLLAPSLKATSNITLGPEQEP